MSDVYVTSNDGKVVCLPARALEESDLLRSMTDVGGDQDPSAVAKFPVVSVNSSTLGIVANWLHLELPKVPEDEADIEHWKRRFTLDVSDAERETVGKLEIPELRTLLRAAKWLHLDALTDLSARLLALCYEGTDGMEDSERKDVLCFIFGVHRNASARPLKRVKTDSEDSCSYIGDDEALLVGHFLALCSVDVDWEVLEEHGLRQWLDEAPGNRVSVFLAASCSDLCAAALQLMAGRGEEELLRNGTLATSLLHHPLVRSAVPDNRKMDLIEFFVGVGTKMDSLTHLIPRLLES